MYEVVQLSRIGISVIVVVPKTTQAHLLRTCFRNLTLPRAGIFRTWRSAKEVFYTPEIGNEFLKDVAESIGELRRFKRHQGNFSITIEHDEFVGWAATDALVNYDSDSYGMVRKSSTCTIQMIFEDRNDILAPLTKEVTIAYDLKYDQDKKSWVVIVYELYPGPDYGELEGDVSAREGFVFFDIAHAGEPLPVTEARTFRQSDHRMAC